MLGQALKNIGQLAGWGMKGALSGRFGGTVAGAAWGGAAGAGWGMLSSDTSVIGGALMGAGLGAGGARYGGRFNKYMQSTYRGTGMGLGARYAGAARSAGMTALRDARHVRLAANRGFNRITSSMKGWGAGFGGGI